MADYYYDSMDLRVPVQHVIRNWAWIFGATVLTAVAAAAFTLWLPTIYQAEATVAISPTRTEVQFDPRIQTLDDYELVNGTLLSRRDALAALMKSNEVMQAVLMEVGNHLKPEERTLEWLRSTGTVETAGDLINLEVRYGDPNTAALIANAWIANYERHVNQIYSTRSNMTVSQVTEQVNEAQESYDSAQVALEAFEATSPGEMLQRELDTTMAILDNYQQARISAQTRPADRNQQILNGYYQELAQIEGWLADASALREQVANDTGSTAGNLGNALALITLRNRVFGGSNDEGAGVLLQFDLGTLEADAIRPADLESLIDTLEARQQAAQERIDGFLQELQTGEEVPQMTSLDERITTLTEQIAGLRSEIEATTAEQRELAQARDNAWETYQLLLSQQVEEQVASQTTSTEVRIADRAIVPQEAVSRGLIRNTALAGILGAMVAAGVVLVRAWWTMGEEGAKREEAMIRRGENQGAADGAIPASSFESAGEEQATAPRAPDTLPT